MEDAGSSRWDSARREAKKRVRVLDGASDIWADKKQGRLGDPTYRLMIQPSLTTAIPPPPPPRDAHYPQLGSG